MIREAVSIIIRRPIEGEDVSPSYLTQWANDPASVSQIKAMTRRAAAGALLGLAWGAALRAWMVVLALEFGDRPHITWQGTFGGILLPAATMGAMLGVATCAQGSSARKRWRWVILSPLLLVLGPAIATDDFISTLLTTGLGSGAIGVALIGLLGGYALSEIGARPLRWVAGILTILFMVASAYGFSFGGAGSTVTPSKVFGAVLFVLLMALLVAGMGAHKLILPPGNKLKGGSI
jgi:hypothetical protein